MNNDMNVDPYAIEEINSKLKTINRNLSNANQQMLTSLLQSQGFLEGHQFEKARKVTLKNIEQTGITSNNIRHSIEYNEKILDLLYRYDKCKYTGG
ncbi:MULTISPECIES: hypothetical protein [Ruminococcus]|uniref:hypothetical protein n=1 Tax=Ruminococcus TaxID=1263 RepID=UPI003F7EC58E